VIFFVVSVIRSRKRRFHVELFLEQIFLHLPTDFIRDDFVAQVDQFHRSVGRLRGRMLDRRTSVLFFRLLLLPIQRVAATVPRRSRRGKAKVTTRDDAHFSLSLSFSFAFWSCARAYLSITALSINHRYISPHILDASTIYRVSCASSSSSLSV
jgi:hypothetical protein